MKCLAAEKEGVRLTVHVQPKASRSRVTGHHGDALKIAVAAPPVEGKANKELETFLALFFGLAKSSVTLVGGKRGRLKTVLLRGISREDARRKIDHALCPSPPAASGEKEFLDVEEKPVL